MRFKTDLSGMRFNGWTVLNFDEASAKLPMWVCACDCGTHKSVWAADLKRGRSKSCGCEKRKASAAARTTHNMSRHPAYQSWIHMRSRCQNSNDTYYRLYGGRGIIVCLEWLESFEAFWADMGPSWAKGLSIDRINVNGNYEPSNCRWATSKEQALNRRDKRLIETPSGQMSAEEASIAYNLPLQTIRSRIKYGWKDPHEMVKPARKWG